MIRAELNQYESVADVQIKTNQLVKYGWLKKIFGGISGILD